MGGVGSPVDLPLPEVLCVLYRQEKTAVFLQSTQESQEGHAGDDDAGDQQNVGHAKFSQGGAECSHLEVYRQVHAKAQHCHAAHLTGGNVQYRLCSTLLLYRNFHLTCSSLSSPMESQCTFCFSFQWWNVVQIFLNQYISDKYCTFLVKYIYLTAVDTEVILYKTCELKTQHIGFSSCFLWF